MNRFLRTFAVMLLAIIGYVAANATTYTVYFDNSVSNWSTVKAYIWGSKGNYAGAWSGTAMTATTISYNGKTLYSYTFESTESDGTSGTLKCIFNNGSTQTGDNTLTNNYVYQYTTSKGTAKVVGQVVNGQVVSVDVKLYTYTAYYDNSSTKWSSVCAYVYGAAEYAGAWPGKACTETTIEVNGAKLWKYEIKDVMNAASDYKIIFNGNGTGQTGNLELVDGNVYSGTAGTVIGTVSNGVYTASQGGGGGGDDTTTPVFYVLGTQNSWTASDAYKMTNTGTNDSGEVVYKLTVANFSGEFKVATSDWKTNFGGADDDVDYDTTTKLVNFKDNDSTKAGWYNGVNFTTTGTNLTFYLYYVAGTGVDGSTQNSFVRVTNGVTSVEDLSVSNNTPAVYYNLSGVRVDNPQNGLFIRVANGKAEKVMMK
jgi:Starch-binding module 26